MANGREVIDICYDGDGNRLSSTGAGLPATSTFSYNNRGRMETADSNDARTNYLYNALGQRIEKSGGPAGTILYVYDLGGHLLGEYTSTGALIQETIWMNDTPVATLRPNGSSISIYYVHADHLNSPVLVTNPSGNAIVWRWDNDPFGSAQPNQNPSADGSFVYNLRLPGQYYDEETGLNYNYFRDYDANVGRYIESDPVGLKGGVNTYGYVNQNPILLSDPEGLLSQVVTSCVCSYMKSNGYSAWQAWSASLANRNNPGPWNDPVLRPCENYLYAYAAVADYGDPAWYVDLGVFGHDFLKRIGRSNTSPPSDEARDAGYEGASDGASHKDWKKQCQGGCSH
jgi:RHS repeat-associated protein